MRILVVEDEPTLQAQLVAAIAGAGHTVEAAADGREAQYLGEVEDFDAVVLDLGLPLIDGLSVLRHWRAAQRKMPVLILTARSSWQEKVAGMDAGADDYLAKPFDLDELEARVRALARRHAPARPAEFCGLAADADSGAIYHRGQAMELTTREAALLRALLARPRHAVAKERLLELVFPGESDVQPEAVEVVAYRLRKKLAGTGAALVTLRGLGYLLKEGD